VLHAQAQNPAPDAAKPVAPAASSPVAPNDPDYKIGPQDVLTINVWKEPDVSAKFGAARRKNFLAAAERRGSGWPDTDAAREFAYGKYEEIHQQPTGDGNREGDNSRRVYVIGEVVRAGTFPLLPR